MPKYVKKKALKNAIDCCTWYHINKNGELVEGAGVDDEPLYKYSDIKKIIKGLPTRKFEDEPQTYCGDFADRLAYERGVKHAWEVAQKVFDSTVTFYEAEDVAKQIDKDINVRSKTEPATKTETQNSNLTFKTLEYCDICDHKGCGECVANALDEHCIPSQFKKQIEDECAKEYEELGLKELKELIEADRKTEPLDKDINVRSKDEPTWEQVKECCNKRCLDIVDSALRGKWYKEEPHIVGKHADVIIIDEPNNSEIPNNCEPKICDTCRYYNSNIPCGLTPSACKKADKFAKEFVDGLMKIDCGWK